MGVSMQVVPHSNGAGDNKRKGGEDGSEPSAKKTRFGAFFCQPCFFVIVKFCQPCFLVIVIDSPLTEVHMLIHNRVDGDDIVICEEVTSPSADDLKKAKKVSVARGCKS